VQVCVLSSMMMTMVDVDDYDCGGSDRVYIHTAKVVGAETQIHAFNCYLFTLELWYYILLFRNEDDDEHRHQMRRLFMAPQRTLVHRCILHRG